MRTIVGSSNKNTKDIKKAERIVNLDKNILAVPTNVSQYGAGGSDIKELETAKHWASEAEKSAKDAENSANKAEDFMDKTIEASEGIEENLETSHGYLEEIKAISKKIDGQEVNIDTLEKSTVSNAAHAEADAKIASDSAIQARTSEANAAASASSANNSAVSSKESEQAAFLSKEYAIAAATEGHQVLAQTEAVYDKTIDDVSQAVQSYLKDKGGFDPGAGLPKPDSWFDIFGVEKKLSCLWTADVAGTIPDTGVGFNEGDILIYNAIVDRYGRFSGELVTGGGGGGPTEFFNDIKLAADKRLLGTDSKGSAVELIKLVNDIVEAGDKTKPMHILAKDPKSAFVCVANSSTGFDNYQIYHEGNKPTPASLGAYTKTEVDDKFVDLAGTKTMTGPLSTTASVYVKSQEVYHPGNKPPASDLDAVSLTKSETISGRKKFTQGPIIEGIAPQLSLTESDTGTEVIVKVESKKLTMSTATSTPFDVDFNNSSVVMSSPKAKGAQGTTADALVRKDYADTEIAKKLNHTGNGTLTGDLVVTGKVTVEGTGSIFKDINTTGQVKENNIRVYSPANKPNAIDVGALPISGGSVGGALNVVGNITTDGTISEKGQRVYSPNNKPTPADIGASVAADEWKLKSKGIGSSSSATDFDTIMDLGWYHSSSAANLYTNAPSGSSGAFTLYVDSIGPSTTTYRRQTVYDYNSSKTWVREKVTNGWRGWAQVYDTRNKPTAADVGAIGIDNVYDKTQADARFWQRTETVNRAFSADATNSYAKNASDFKDVGNFRSYLSNNTYTGWPANGTGSGIFQGRISGTNSYGFALHQDYGSGFWYGKQKSDGSGFDWYKLYHEGNKPSAGDINTYTKSEIDSKDNLKLNLTGGTVTGKLTAAQLYTTNHTLETGHSGSWDYVPPQGITRMQGPGGPHETTVYTGLSLGWQGSQDYGATVAFRNNSFMFRTLENKNWGSWNRLYHTGNKPTASDVGALPITGGTMASGGITFQQAFPASGNQAHIFHDGRGTSGTPSVLRSMREATGATWLWEKVSNGSLYYGAGTTGTANKIRFNASGGEIYLGNADKKVFHEGNLLFSKTPDVDKLVQRDNVGAIQALGVYSTQNSVSVYNNPNGGRFSSGSQTGSIKITLPKWKSTTMLKLHISVFNYASDTSFDVVAAGYDYNDGKWVNCTAVIIGGASTPNHPVYFGNDGSKACIWIGSVGQAWQYPKVVINSVEASHTAYDSGWYSGYAISMVTSLGTVSRTISDALVKPGGANIPADEQPTANTLVKRNASGNIAAKGRILLASSNDSDVGAGTGSIDLVSSAGNVYGQIGDIDSTSNLSVRSNAPITVLTLDSSAQKIYTGGVLASNSYGDANKVPDNGIYSKGGITTDGDLKVGSSKLFIEGVNVIGASTEVTRFGDGTFNREMNLNAKSELVYVQAAENQRKRVYHQGFKPTASEVGAVNKAGDTMTGALRVPSLQIENTNNTSGAGLRLYGNSTFSGMPDYGLAFAGTSTFGKHGSVQGDWATYLTMSGATNRGWVFKSGNTASGNVASISATGAATFDGGVHSGARIKMSPINGSGSFGIIKHQTGSGGESWLTAIDDGISNHSAIGVSQNEGPKCWISNTMHRIYHQGYKPTTADIGAVSSNYKSFSVKGDGNKFYLVKFPLYNEMKESIYIHRSYGATIGGADSNWNGGSTTHFGMMSIKASGNGQAWGGARTGLVLEISQQYTNTIGNVATGGSGEYYLYVWLRGSPGGATYSYSYGNRSELPSVIVSSEYITASVAPYNSSSHSITNTAYSDIHEQGSRVYSARYKPNANDVGAFPIGGGTITGNLTISAKESNELLLHNNQGDSSEATDGRIIGGITSKWYNDTLKFGHARGGSTGSAGFSIKLNNSNLLRVDGNNLIYKTYPVYHDGRKPSAADVGAVTSSNEAGRYIGRIAHNLQPTAYNYGVGAYVIGGYNNSAPTAYGETLHMRGTANGAGQIYIDWGASPSGTSATPTGNQGGVYVRSCRDNGDRWTEWAKVYTTHYKPTATDVGAIPMGGTTSTIYSNDWFRSNGATGWYSQTYQGGIHMSDTTWVRIYGNKKFYVPNTSADAIYTSGGVTASGNVTAYSDRRVKDDIKNIPNALEKVMKLNGVTYTRTDQEDKDKRHTGVIAQEVEAVLPEAVITSENGDIKDFKSVAYGNLVGLLIEAIKEQQKQIEELKCKK